MQKTKNGKNYTNLAIEQKENSEIEIKAEIPENILSEYRERVIKDFSKDIELKGFRKGHIPKSILMDKIGEQTIIEKQASLALADIYPNIVMDNNLNVIGKPEVIVTKLAPKNPVGFTIKTAIMPEIKLSDYKKIARSVILDKTEANVSEKEMDDVIEQIKKGAAINKSKKNNLEENLKKNGEQYEKLELTDDFVKTLGDFKDLADFKNKIKENLTKEKSIKKREKRRAEIIEKIIKDTKIDIPKIFVESELDKMLAQFKDDVARMNVQFNKYLEKIKKTENELRNEWKNDAEKRAKIQLSLNEIAKKENVSVSEENVKHEVNHILEHYKDAKPESVRVYIETVLTNEKVFQFLENQE
ncbi:hypothetical protein COT82_01225 [Candidatus Campbellbacteria bacterium CG10_big_fil_rev_8_21_14_0_10_35_52]|uniref:Uncharacterized protein n=1 Tax=Candidatus Campbellbacteria bacterium CG10_big_fil_rev_8_21_14_0_10_35_52 TaxID=1974527 RepID=A0A2M6WVJ5_9BACT|nr:MAG: hypothetical protein COT82_01225 [Candidatus Campbellbacteria bacterium CG10_big_fil_rev_8_21_14_0_10_35_52]